MRNASMAVLREIGVETGGSNVQFGINLKDGRMVIIEMNPRVSRSSALASKATGFPSPRSPPSSPSVTPLDELMNDITGGRTLPPSSRPSTTGDWCRASTSRKSPVPNDRLTTQMKSVVK